MMCLDKELIMKCELDLKTICSKQSMVIRERICFEVLVWNFFVFLLCADSNIQIYWRKIHLIYSMVNNV